MPNEIDAPRKEPINTTDLDSRLVRTLGRQAAQGCNA
jgi:hypothetical protein